MAGTHALTIERGRLGVPCALLFVASACASAPHYHPNYQPNPSLALPGADLLARVILVGDAGDPPAATASDDATADVLRSIQQDVAGAGARTLVAFLGDNVYEHGLPPDDDDDPDHRCAGTAALRERRINGKQALERQIHAAGAAARILFVPGNHDWRSSDECAVRQHVAEGKFVTAASGGKASLLPLSPCPGPAEVDWGVFRFFAFNSEWLLRRSDRLAAGCAAELAPRETAYGAVAHRFFSQLEAGLKAAPNPVLVLLSHHPLQSVGEHGGHPSNPGFPIRWLAGRFFLHQDFWSPAYGSLRDSMQGIVDRVAPALPGRSKRVVYAAGHDHSLQVLNGKSDAALHIVSGSGSKLSPVGGGSRVRFSDSEHGYVVLDAVTGPDGRRRLFVEVVVVRGAERTSAFSEEIGDIP